MTGGKVENTASGDAIQNAGTGTITISGGTVSATSGFAIHMTTLSTGGITISESANITSGNTSNGTIYLLGDGALNITSGTVKNTANGSAIYVGGTSGGTITISGTANIISENTSAYQGTILLDNGSTGTLYITGGTVENTASGGNAIYNQNSTVEINGGTINGEISGAGSTTISGGTINGEMYDASGTAVCTPALHTPSAADCTVCDNACGLPIKGASHTFTEDEKGYGTYHDFKCKDCEVRGGNAACALTVCELCGKTAPPEQLPSGGGTSGGTTPDMTPFYGVSGSDPKPETTTPKDAPADWANAAVKKATELGLIPERLQGKWRDKLSRADFCALAVKLYEYLDGKPITARAYFDDTDDLNVQKLAGLGIVTGDGTGKFDPNGAFTREMALTLMYNMMTQLGYTYADAEPSFADAGDISPWAKQAIGALQKAGVVEGDGQYFNPALIFTREMGVVTVIKFLEQMK